MRKVCILSLPSANTSESSLLDLCTVPLFFLEPSSLASVLFCQAIAQGPPLRQLLYKQFWKARGQSRRKLVWRGGNTQGEMYTTKRAALWRTAQLDSRKTDPLLAAPAPPWWGLSRTGPPMCSGSPVRTGADDEFMWVDLQRTTTDCSGLVKSVSSRQNITQNVAGWTSWNHCHQSLSTHQDTTEMLQDRRPSKWDAICHLHCSTLFSVLSDEGACWATVTSYCRHQH